MRTNLTTAIEVVLGLPSLHLKMEAEAQAGIYRLNCNELWKPKSVWYWHASKAQDMMREPILQMGTDKMILRYAFHKPFMVRLRDRSEWDRGIVPVGKKGTHLVHRWVQDIRRHWNWGVWPWHEAEI
jgi:hypothetical protein